MSLKFNKNNALTLISIVILLIGFFIQNFYISILCTLFFYGAILLSSTSYAIYLVLFSMPLSGIFDDSGFLHFFNFAIIVLFVRLLIQLMVERRVNKNFILVILLVLFLALYDVFNATINNLLSVGYFNNFSIWIGYLLIAAISFYYELINRQKCLLFLYLGFIVSCALCGFQIYNRWGFDVPDLYRFVGLLRDPNYYSFTVILICFSALYILHGKIKFIVIVSSFVLGALSVSKMFIFLFAFGLLMTLLYRLYLIYRGKNTNELYIVLVFLGLVISVFIANYTGLLDLILSKYYYRFNNYDLTTGRDYIQGKYLSILLNEIQSFILGRSLDYNYVYMISYADSKAMVAHNTYLDLIMSFGIIGTIIYIFMIYNLIRLYKKNIHIGGYEFVLLVLILSTLFALSYLKADGFSIYILFYLLSCKKECVVTNDKEINYVHGDSQEGKIYTQG